MSLEITPSLKDALRELYYKEGCDQKGWAYIALKDIDIKGNVLVFNKGVHHRISIKLMDKIVPEVREISSRSVNGNFLFDYLACKVGQQSKYEDAMLANPAALCWIKTRDGAFSSDQIDVLHRIKLPLAVFRIKDVLAPPAKVEMKWDIRSGEEWLDELDDLRDQTESDDEYF